MDTCTLLLLVFLAALALFCRLRWMGAEHECNYWQRTARDYQSLYYATLERLPAQQASVLPQPEKPSVIPPPNWN